jgi:hypothetical protein
MRSVRARCCSSCQELAYAPVPDIVHPITKHVCCTATCTFLQSDARKSLMDAFWCATERCFARLAILVLKIDCHISTGFTVEERLAVVRRTTCGTHKPG